MVHGALLGTHAALHRERVLNGTHRVGAAAGAFLVALVVATGHDGALSAAPAPSGGTIKGHVRLSGKEPGNSIIRMGMDPMCAALNKGARVVQEAVLVSLNGSLANVFVSLEGSFPKTTVPTTPVTIDQRGCMYGPRVVGLRVGQTLQVRNNDELMHNVHGVSSLGNGFNVSQPKAGMTRSFQAKDGEIMVRLRCDVHNWMTAFIGVVSHPYFDVTTPAGTFEIGNVPAGTYRIQAWHERYGSSTQSVTVKSGATTMIEFAYTGTGKPRP